MEGDTKLTSSQIDESNDLENMVKISKLFVYPIKSCHEVELNQSKVSLVGLENDRTLVILRKKDNKFISLRTHRQMYDIEVTINHENIFEILIPGCSPFQVKMNNNDIISEKIIRISIWDIENDVYPVGTEELNKALSDLLREEVIIVKPLSRRKVGDYDRLDKFTNEFKQTDETNFADLAPILLTSQESFDYINKLVRDKTGESLDMKNFRPNIVVAGTNKVLEPFWENKIKRIKIGNVILRRLKGCVRCKMTTFDTVSKTYRQSKEPLEVLDSECYDDKLEGVVFGQNFCVDLLDVEDKCTIEVGDDVEIIFE